jgi:hypothetical protein
MHRGLIGTFILTIGIFSTANSQAQSSTKEARKDETSKEESHLSSASCKAEPEHPPKQITAIYREISPISAPHGSYTTIAFHGGYVGLVADPQGNGGRQINFSIWGSDATPVESAEKRYGEIKSRQFTHEGVGWAGRLAYPWKAGVKYKVCVLVTHQNNTTTYSAWFGEASKNDWLLAGRIRTSGTVYLGRAGGFLEHVGKQNKELRRCTAYGSTWVHDGVQWLPCTHVRAELRDPANAHFYQKNKEVFVEIGSGIKSEQGSIGDFRITDIPNSPPNLPKDLAAH